MVLGVSVCARAAVLRALSLVRGSSVEVLVLACCSRFGESAQYGG